MRLFHVSEEADIPVFHPRTPSRPDLDPNIPLIWAIDEAHLPNFLTPRDCPRVTYHAGPQTTPEDASLFFSSAVQHVVVIEQKWFEIMKNTTLYLYEFDPSDFELQDAVAGYYVAKSTQVPIGKYHIDDLFAALFQRGVELRIVENLWPLRNRVLGSSLNFSFCRMAFAQPRK